MNTVALIEEVGEFMGACGGGAIQKIPPLPNGIEQGACIGGFDAAQVLALALFPLVIGLVFLIMVLSYFSMRVSPLSTTRGVQWIRKRTIQIGLVTTAIFFSIALCFYVYLLGA
jgi:hypothetical protein